MRTTRAKPSNRGAGSLALAPLRPPRRPPPPTPAACVQVDTQHSTTPDVGCGGVRIRALERRGRGAACPCCAHLPSTRTATTDTRRTRPQQGPTGPAGVVPARPELPPPGWRPPGRRRQRRPVQRALGLPAWPTGAAGAGAPLCGVCLFERGRCQVPAPSCGVVDRPREENPDLFVSQLSLTPLWTTFSSEAHTHHPAFSLPPCPHTRSPCSPACLHAH